MTRLPRRCAASAVPRLRLTTTLFLAVGGLLLAVSSATGGESAWQPLFDGETLDSWKSTQFGGEGDVHVERGAIHLEFGSPLTGITYTQPFPRVNYEVELEARRIDGIDFFCALTFPVDDAYCSFVVGGWAGSVVGLSSIDGKDASENDTTRYMNFETGRWYRIRLRVTPVAIQAWIDDQQVVDQPRANHKISTRNEVSLSAPLGIATFETRAALRKLRFRELKSASGPGAR